MKIREYEADNIEELSKYLLRRSQLKKEDIQKTVNEIIENVRTNGDKALFEYTKKFDKANINSENVKVSEKEIEEAFSLVDKELIRVMKKSAERIRIFHEKQKTSSWFETSENGEIMGQIIRPLEKAGVYVPGGKAAYPSSVLMNVIPAKVAGVEKIVMTTPPSPDGNVYPTTIAAAKIAGVDEIYKAGGAQAIAALAFGTESIPKTDKIAGPGNIFVALAKRSVYGFTDIDSVAGPSEILVIADETANASYAAADLLSQAEHDELASAILVSTSKAFAEKVKKELERQTELLERKEIIRKSLENYGALIIADSIEQAAKISNIIAPEHMEVCIKAPFELLPLIKNAGAVFLGNYSPEPLGDYMAGPNHVLPTGSTARFFSPLSVDDFVKKSSLISFSKGALENLGDDIMKFAEAEGLTAHANSIRLRMNNK